MTALFDQIIFGPIHSRRLGLSLGVNLLPVNNKLCSFNCIYCECGWGQKGVKVAFNNSDKVIEMLEVKLTEMGHEGQLPDVITFAGNGEPTMHPDFEQIIDRTISLRDKLAPKAKVSVLSNATMIDRESVRRALMRVDNNILKLDSAFDDTVQIIDKPNGNYSVKNTVELMKLFHGNLIIQTMFLRGEYDGQKIDNTVDREVNAWIDLLKQIAPKQVMVYSIDRDTPAENLQKVSKEELETIAEKVRTAGIDCISA